MALTGFHAAKRKGVLFQDFAGFRTPKQKIKFIHWYADFSGEANKPLFNLKVTAFRNRFRQGS